MDSNSSDETTNLSLGRSPRRALLVGFLGATLGAHAGGTSASSRSRKRSRQKAKCSRPGKACKTHEDCCTKGGMCVEAGQGDSDDKKQSRRCAAA